MAVSPLQESFNAGELSKRLRGRVTSELYKRGLDYCDNLRPTPQGSLLMRAGSEKGHAEEYAGAGERLIRFRMSDEQDYLIDLTDLVMRIFNISGDPVPVDTGSVNIVQNGDFQLGALNWTGTGAVSGGVCDVSYGTYKEQVINVLSAGTYKLRLYSNFLSLQEAGNVRVGTASGGAQLLNAYPYLGGVYNGWHEYTFVVAAPGNIYLRLTGPAHVWWVDNVSIINMTGSYAIVSPWASDKLPDIQHTVETGRDAMIFVHGAIRPYELVRATDGTWAFNAKVFTAEPADWDPAWPESVEMYDGRAYYTIKNRFWASKAGTTSDMTIGSNPGDAMDYKLASKGSIRWLQGQRTLLCGTDIGELSITGSKGTPLVGDIQIRDESAFGSAKIQGINAGSVALFVAQGRREIRSLTFDLQTNGWESKAVTFIAEHMTKDLVKELHYTRLPEGLILALTKTGKLVACTYDPGENAIAWWRVTMSGEVISAAVSEGPSGAFLWMAVKRGTKRVLERLPLGDDDGLRYLDSSISAIIPENGSVAFDHLANGTKVKVLIDGALEANEYEVAAGAVALDPAMAGKAAVIGLGFTAKAVTLPLNVKSGKAHHAKIGITLNDSALPKINGKRPPDRSPATPQDTAEPRYSGKVDVGNLGWDGEGKITIEQDQPYRTEILALYSRTQAEEV